ncbi:MAG TPA: substrate-binding domain-containing protein [Tepidisphaeraceae bacterium]
MTTTTQQDVPVQPRTQWGFVFLLVLIALGAGIWYSGVFEPKPRIAIVTASQGPFWDLLARGATEAAASSDVTVEIIRSSGDAAEQTKLIQSLIGKGYQGVGVSANDPANQAAVLSELGAQTNLIMFDSDCPISQRLCFIGSDNYDAGRSCGEFVAKACPEGGEVVICVGSLEKENGQRRRQGVVDFLMDRPASSARQMDPVDAPLKGPKYTIVATLVDNLDPQRAQAMAAEALEKHPNVKCFVGLFASNTPSILRALEQKQKSGKVHVVGFDFNDETLAGIENGQVYASMMQDAYNIGAETVKILADVSRGNKLRLPMFQVQRISCDAVTKENLPEVRAKLASKSNAPAPSPASAAPATQSASAQ